MTKWKISVDMEKCIGCGACTGTGLFELKDDNKAHPTEPTIVTDKARHEEVAGMCPVEAIIIKPVDE